MVETLSIKNGFHQAVKGKLKWRNNNHALICFDLKTEPTPNQTMIGWAIVWEPWRPICNLSACIVYLWLYVTCSDQWCSALGWVGGRSVILFLMWYFLSWSQEILLSDAGNIYLWRPIMRACEHVLSTWCAVSCWDYRPLR